MKIAHSIQRVSPWFPSLDRIGAAAKRAALSGVALSFLLLDLSCVIFQPRDEPNGVVITVRAAESTIPRVGAFVCRPKTISREGVMGFEIDAHVRRLEGDNCAWITFTCADNTRSAETRVCVGDPPVNTGCRTVDGNPIRIEVTSTFE